MDLRTNETLNLLMDKLADNLNISITMEDKAVCAYNALGEWLEGNDEGREIFVYPQGSFALGTVVRPLSGEDDDYDIDLVCQMPDMVYASAEAIKRLPGKRLKQHGTYAQKLEPEGKRCWTLRYDEFHVDVLPCTNQFRHVDGPVRLTHKDPASCEFSDRFSNPKGYKEWFEDRMGDCLREAKSRYAGKVLCSVDHVETFRVKTPLQKAIQILKHHRNLMFEGKDNKPISIIITTLAARAYQDEIGTYDALVGILSRMEQHIEGGPGCYRVVNPSNPDENFAERWNEEPAKAAAFFSWVKKAKTDFVDLGSLQGLNAIGESLEDAVGETMSKRAINAHAESVRSRRDSGKLFVGASGLTGVGSNAAKAVPRHTFYGDE